MSKLDLGIGLDYYKSVIDVQMHFNDMLLRLRSLGLTAIVSLLAIAGAVMTKSSPDYLLFLGVRINVAGVFGFCGLVLSIFLFVMDRFYYYTMLTRAVQVTKDFEDNNLSFFEGIGISGAPLTSALSNKVPRVYSDWLVIAFWLIPALICLALTIEAIR